MFLVDISADDGTLCPIVFTDTSSPNLLWKSTLTTMTNLPSVLWMEILSYLPPRSHLPVAHVSKDVRQAWHAMKKLDNDPTTTDAAFQTSPLRIGHLFLTPWYKPSKMKTKLLQYYITSCGWNYQKHHAIKLIRECISRGDLEGLVYLVDRNLGTVNNDSDYCAVAGAAGQLDVLQWLREVHQCPWDPEEVYREASENVHLHIMHYVELKAHNSATRAARHDLRSCTGYGMPW